VVAARRDLVVGEGAEPAHAREDARLVFGAGEGGLGCDGPFEVVLAGAGSADDFGGGFGPGEGGGGEGGEVVGGFVGEEANVDEDADELGEAAVAEGAADEVLGLGDVVALLVGCAVAVGVGDEVVCGRSRVSD